MPGPGHRILAALATLGEFQARVGWFSSAKYRNGVAVAYIAAIQEFGYAPKNIPPRLGLRDMLKKNEGEYRTLANQLVKAVVNGMSAKDALIAIGGKSEGDIRKTITRDGIEPLKKSTLQNRASRLGIALDELTETGKKPLVEPVMSKAAGGGAGGLLLASVVSMVVPKGTPE